MTDELTFLRELEPVVQRVHNMLHSHRYAFVHGTDPTEHSLLAKKLINDRIIELLEEEPTKSCSALQGTTAFGIRATCTLNRGHELPHKWSTP